MTEIFAVLSGPELSIPVIIVRLLYGSILGGIVGFERERRNHSAGFRTHILICLGATMLMLLSLYIPQQFGSPVHDPGRIAAQVVSGIGFLGAGAIVRLGMDVRGLTSAASIWVIAGLGLLCGAGMYLTALISVAIMLFVLEVLDRASRALFPKGEHRLLVVSGERLQDRLPELQNLAAQLGIQVRGISLDYESKKEGTRVAMEITVPPSLAPDLLINRVTALGRIKKVSVEFQS